MQMLGHLCISNESGAARAPHPITHNMKMIWAARANPTAETMRMLGNLGNSNEAGAGGLSLYFINFDEFVRIFIDFDGFN